MFLFDRLRIADKKTLQLTIEEFFFYNKKRKVLVKAEKLR